MPYRDRVGTNGCAWRRNAMEFMNKYCDEMIRDESDNKVASYTQIVDRHGFAAPQQARVRHMLNVIAAMKGMDLNTTPAIVDTSQSLERKSWRFDGTVPPIATNTTLWPMKLARFLTFDETAALMGHRMCDVDRDFKGIRKTARQHLIGNSIHVATLGSLMIAQLAAACPDVDT